MPEEQGPTATRATKTTNPNPNTDMNTDMDMDMNTDMDMDMDVNTDMNTNTNPKMKTTANTNTTTNTTMSATTTKLLASRNRNLGILALNNPGALHALTSDMVDALGDALRSWKRDPTVRAVLLKSTTSNSSSNSSSNKRPAFCSGGDVKSIYYRGMELDRHLQRQRQSENQNRSQKQKQKQDQKQKENEDHYLDNESSFSTPTPTTILPTTILLPTQIILPTTPTTTPTTPPPPPEDFFFREYRVNHEIAVYPLPIVSLWDGLVLGGGVGISIHGRYRVATERTVFGMPECGIGFFPDVGSTWWMPRLLSSSSLARYLALTGRTLARADLLWTGLATHYVPSHRLGELEDALAVATESNRDEDDDNDDDDDDDDDDYDDDDAVERVLASFHEPIPTEDCHLAIHRSDIERTFRGGTIEEILRDLRQDVQLQLQSQSQLQSTNDFASKVMERLQKQSPTSLRVTLEGLERGERDCETIGQALGMEYRMAKALVRGKPPRESDFYEGVRAALVDKDRSPEWNPAATEKMVREIVMMFAPIEEEWTPFPDERPAKL